MVRVFTFLLFAFVFKISAQTTAPKLINYQGVARDASGNPITSAFDIQFTISNSSSTVHNEVQTGIQPNQFGLFSTKIGSVITLTPSAWNAGPYTLNVSIKTGSTFTLIGSQSLVSVPFSLFANDVPSSYINNILTIGNSSYSISTGTSATPTITGTGLVTVTPTTGLLYSVDVPTPSLNYVSAGNILTLTQGSATSSVALIGTSSSTISIAGAGIAQVNPTTGSSFTVTVPPPTVSFGSNQLTLTQGTVSTTTSINSTIAGDVTGPIGTTTVTALRNYPVSSAAPVNNQVLTFLSGSWIPAAPPALPTLGLSGSTLTSGPATNTVNLVTNGDVTGGITTTTVTGLRNIPVSAVTPTLGQVLSLISGSWTPTTPTVSAPGPWQKVSTNVSLIVATDNVGIGTASPAAKLEVAGSATTNLAIIKASNTNASNTVAAIQASSNGGQAISGSETSVSGSTAGQFSSVNGVGVLAASGATNATSHAIQAISSSTFVGNLAGYFDGGMYIRGKTSTASGNALTVQNSSSNNLVVVRNDGNTSVGGAPLNTKLNVAGQVTIIDGSQGDGKMLVSNTVGTGTWRSSPPTQVFTGLNNAAATINSSGAPLNTSIMGFTKLYANSEIHIDLYSRASSGNFSGAASISFQIRVDGNSSPLSTIHYIFSTNTTEYISLKAVFQGLPVGSHTITIWGVTDNGSSSNVYIDPGGFGGNVILKEIY